MKAILSITISLFVVFLSCKTKDVSLTDTTTNSKTQAVISYDFETLKSWIGKSRVVGLGESTHGIGDYFSLKSDMVMRLHNFIPSDRFDAAICLRKGDVPHFED